MIMAFTALGRTLLAAGDDVNTSRAYRKVRNSIKRASLPRSHWERRKMASFEECISDAVIIKDPPGKDEEP
jgi:hypothetical protein